MIEANKEVQGLDNYVEENFEELYNNYEKTREHLTQGVIVEIKNDEVYVDICRKLEGVLALHEIQDENLNALFKVGDTIKIAVIGNRDGRAILSHKKALRKEKVVEFIKNYKDDEDKIYEVKIINKNKGGYVVVDKDDIEFFLPRSHCGFIDKATQDGKKSFKVELIKLDKDEQSIVVSRKKIIQDENKKKKEALQNILQQEEPIEGIVKKITSYGMFVDVGGVDGLVHYSEISYKGPINPSSLYKEGDKVLVKVINYDKEKRHLSLSAKAAMPNPWSEIKDKLEVGDTIKVTVSNIEPYGAFVDLGNDIEGFLHVSEISWDKNIKNPKDYISKGQEIDVEVIEIDSSLKRLRVSLRKLLAKPFDGFVQKYKTGDILDGEITTITSFGAFVRIDADIEGLLHNEDASWDRSKKCKDLFKISDKIKVKIIKIDKENQKISLSIRELEDSPVINYAKEHKVGDIVKAKIKDFKDFGIFVELGNNVEALIHKEDFGNLNLEELKVGDELEAAISLLDEKRHRIRLSIRNLSKIKERELLNKINDKDKMTLGDIIKEKL